jgi:probable HAF family extracellular repeat protein
MKTKIVLRTTFTLVLVLLIGITIASGQGTRGTAKPAQAPSQVQYMVIDFGEDGIANDILDSGRIVGSKNFGGPQRHATFWPNIGTLPIDLGTLPDGFGSRGFGINPQGRMVGYDFPADFSGGRPLFWANSHSSPIELPGLPAGDAIASDINPAGQIVGLFADDSGASPVFWANSNTPAIYLPRVSDRFPNGQAFSINASGNILGVACNADFTECHVAFWADSMSTPVALASPDEEFIYTDLGLSSDFTVAHALNNAGSMVGFAVNADGSETRAVFWANASSPAVILGASDEFPNGTAEGINNKGQIVGTAYNNDFSAFHAFFWPSPTSQGIDLNAVIPPDSGLEIAIARSINNRGVIAGAAYPNGEPPAHAIVLVPVNGDSAQNIKY